MNHPLGGRIDHRPRQNGITFLSEHPPLEHCIARAPEFLGPSTTPVENAYTILGPQTLCHEKSGRLFSIETGLAIRALNAMFTLQSSQESWVDGATINTYFFNMRTDRSIASGSFTRGLDALDTLRHESDGEKEFVQRSARGSGSRPRYRIDPAVSFVDTRTSEQLSPFAATLSRLHDIATELRRREY